MEQSGIPIIVLGFLLGIKHSLDVDHLAAVSTLVTGTKNTLRSMVVGAAWGLGHSLALFVTGGAIILLDLRFPPEVSLGMEGLVGAMLIFLGGRVFYRLSRGGVLHVHSHIHGDHVHIHPHIHGPGERDAGGGGVPHHHGVRRAPRSSRMSFWVGMVHGLAGSAGLTLILLPTIPTRGASLLYLLVFGVGTICGMALSTLVLSFPLRALGSLTSPGAAGRLRTSATLLAGCVSLVIGTLLLWETCVPLFFS